MLGLMEPFVPVVVMCLGWLLVVGSLDRIVAWFSRSVS